jgi:hypothetical protein
VPQPFDAVPPPAPDRVAHTPAWPATPPAPGPVPVAEPRRDTGSLVAAAAVGAAVLSVGVLVAALLSALLLSTALTRAMEAQTEAMFGGGYTAGVAVEQTDPVPPGTLGTDPALDGYAADCFAAPSTPATSCTWGPRRSRSTSATAAPAGGGSSRSPSSPAASWNEPAAGRWTVVGAGEPLAGAGGPPHPPPAAAWGDSAL